eukprot:CAMPEP_0173451028 /NCGR_PEP_ID=MMETSP1357-20121228/45944_1 /TAXON_ID=77926 /ORGANISM="Hemiselmis rufescens, Strain PCC563" /LENGTH=283 /DNA_ID=CAMNT_0014417751 /DNA_START=63 /DNA_END=911 /DNA_ORIENTATION=+
MTHASGIVSDKELVEALGRAKEGRTPRVMRVQIEEDKLVLAESLEGSAEAKEDFAKVLGMLHDDTPSYILFRLDDKRAPEEWLLLAWVPESAKVRLKMLYASTRDALKKEFGYSAIVCEMHASEKAEATWDEYERASLVSEAERLTVMSQSERDRLKGTHLETGGVKTAYIHAVQFPLSEQAKEALSAMAGGGHGMVLLSIDAKTETVELSHAGTGGVSEYRALLAAADHASSPRYCFLRGGAPPEVAFVFSCPESAPVRAKMLYSTAKSAVVGGYEGIGGQV